MLWRYNGLRMVNGLCPFGLMKCHALETNLHFSNVLMTDLATMTAVTVKMLASFVKVTLCLAKCVYIVTNFTHSIFPCGQASFSAKLLGLTFVTLYMYMCVVGAFSGSSVQTLDSCMIPWTEILFKSHEVQNFY